MASEHSIRRYRNWYARLLRFYSKPYHARFGKSMEQTFGDLLRERAEAGKGLFGLVLWVFLETSAHILREDRKFMAPQFFTRRLRIWAVVVGLILMIPLVGMQFSDEVVWGFFDFVFMGTLLFGAGVVYEWVASRMNSGSYRTAVGLAVVSAVLLVWINAAAGIIGDGDLDSPNALYFLVLAIGFVGALVARFEPRGMARALFAMVVAQLLVPVIALFISDPATWGAPGVLGVFVLNSIFAVLFAGSGLLFRQAGGVGAK